MLKIMKDEDGESAWYLTESDIDHAIGIVCESSNGPRVEDFDNGIMFDCLNTVDRDDEDKLRKLLHKFYDVNMNADEGLDEYIRMCFADMGYFNSLEPED